MVDFKGAIGEPYGSKFKLQAGDKKDVYNLIAMTWQELTGNGLQLGETIIY